MSFKVGDKVRIIKECECKYKDDCAFLKGLNQEGSVIFNEESWRAETWKIKVKIKYRGEWHNCYFLPEQLELIEKFSTTKYMV